MNRHVILYARVAILSRTLGDGPWLWAAAGRLQAATGFERPGLPWYARPNDETAVTIAWERERGRAGYFNRHWRKRTRYARRVLEVVRGEP